MSIRVNELDQYTRNVAGPSTFFDDIDDCHNRLTSLATVVPDHHVLIQYAITAFEASNIPKFDLTEINREWDTELAKKKWVKNKMWIEFKNFFIKKLLSVDVNNNRTKLEANHDILHANMATLEEELDELRTQIDAKVPSVIDTNATTANTTINEFAALEAKMERTLADSITTAIAAAFKKNGGTPGGTPVNNHGR